MLVTQMIEMYFLWDAMLGEMAQSISARGNTVIYSKLFLLKLSILSCYLSIQNFLNVVQIVLPLLVK